MNVNTFLDSAKAERSIVYGLLLIFFVGLTLLAIYSEHVFGYADIYGHYLISHYSFKHPYLFFDHWGKPFYTAISAPFSQFGLIGLLVFNIVISIGSLLLGYLICKKIQINFSWLSMFFILFAPVYFVLSYSGMTESFFGFLLILAVFLFVDKKYIWAAVVLSFIPFVRNEGYVFFPIFAFAFFLRKKWWCIFFLFTGFVVYAIAGYPFYHDLLWFFTHTPYTGAKEIYGQGQFWHFAINYEEIFGLTLVIFLISGIIAIIVSFFNFKKLTAEKLSEIVIILLPPLIYFFAHSYVWWKGIHGSAGLTRVMAGIIPLCGVIAVVGFNFLSQPLMRFKKIVFVISLVIAGFMLAQPFRYYSIPIPFSGEEKVFNDAAAWIKKNELSDTKIFASNTYLFYKLGIDPFDNTVASVSIPMVNSPFFDEVKPGNLIVWDSHFSYNENNIDENTLLAHKNLRLLAAFYPDEAFTSLRNKDYFVYIFQRTVDSNVVDNYQLLNTYKENYFEKTIWFEKAFPKAGVEKPSVSDSCLEILADQEFTPILEKPYSKNQTHFEFCASVFKKENSSDFPVFVVWDLSGKGKIHYYKNLPIELKKMKKNQWVKVAFRYKLPENISDDEAIHKVYFWNNSKNNILVDSIKIYTIEKNSWSR